MDEPMKIEGARRVVVVTGGAQGIGKEVARAFLGAGAAVVVADIDEVAAKAAAADLGSTGAAVIGCGVDVTDEAGVAEMVDSALAEFGRIDVLVNGAAVFSTLAMTPFEDIAVSEWRRVMDVNVTGVFLCCRAVAAVMRSQRSGAIVNVSSATVLSGRPHYLHYVTSKAALVGLTRSMARELGGAGVSVNVLMPGSVETGIPRDSARADAVEAIVANQAIQQRLVPSDIAGAAVFLASDAAHMITGQSLVIDGGMNFL